MAPTKRNGRKVPPNSKVTGRKSKAPIASRTNDNASESSLLSVNDDCLIAICRHLTLIELTAVAATCTRLQFAARRVFVLDAANKHFDITLTTSEYAKKKHTIKQYLRSFGPLLDSIRLEGSSIVTSAIFNWLITYCSGSLERLQVNNLSFNWGLLVGSSLAFSHIKSLQLNNCSHFHAMTMSHLCEDITITSDELGFNFEQWSNPNDFEEFLSNHPRLKKLQLKITTIKRGLYSIAMHIAKLRQLEELRLELPHMKCNKNDEVPSNIALTTPMESISLVAACYDTTFINRMLAAPVLYTSLEYLEIKGCLVDSFFVNNLPRFERLNTLKLGDIGCSFFKHPEALRNVRHLKELELGTWSVTTQVLMNLDSTETLEKLKIWARFIDDGFIEGLGRLRNLAELNFEFDGLEPNLATVNSTLLDQLQRLNTLIICRAKLQNPSFLDRLGPVELLTHLELRCCSLSGHFFFVLRRFRQLRVLKLAAIDNLTSTQLMMINGMVELEKFVVEDLFRYADNIWHGLVNVVQNSGNLKELILGGSSTEKESWINFQIYYQRLLEICRRSERKLLVKHHYRYILFFENKKVYDARYVEMQRISWIIQLLFVTEERFLWYVLPFMSK